jgi:hypothetical protein
MKRLLLCITGVVLLTATVTLVGAGVASAGPLPAYGNVNCAISGSGTFHPHLTAAGSSRAEAIKFIGTSSSCTGTVAVTTAGTPVTITGMTIKGAGKLINSATGTFANSCTAFNTQDVIRGLKLKVAWTATPAIRPTTITYVNGTTPLVSPSGLFDAISAPSGATTTITGSFASSPAALLTLITNVLNTCSSTWGPYSAFTFGSGSFLNIT